ncbi:MAG: hypothetical protein LBL90_05600 [Prevotellaceae bacterium]|nr:hypothetical protein [Prevotellaceae bacterium]
MIVWKQMSFGLMRGRRATSFGSSMPAAGTAAESRHLSGENGDENSRRLEEKNCLI